MNLDFTALINQLHNRKEEKRIVVVCPYDVHTQYVITRGLKEGIARFSLVVEKGRETEVEEIRSKYPEAICIHLVGNVDEAAHKSVALVRRREADVLMKGTIPTDNLLRAVLDKKEGLLPEGGILSHTTVVQTPAYHKLLMFSDAAVIPRPTFAQFEAMMKCNIRICRDLGIASPKVALIHCTEKISEKFPHTSDYVHLIEKAHEGAYGNMQIGGPMDVKTACDIHSGNVKGIQSPVAGDADILIFPNIESGNTFYKTITFFGKAEAAGILTGTISPVILPSRADSDTSKYYSLVLACLSHHLA